MAKKQKYCISIEDVREAMNRIRDRVHRTPVRFRALRRSLLIIESIHTHTQVLTCSSLNEQSGMNLFFKCELFQKTGSFKIRGATNACFSLSDEQAKVSPHTLYHQRSTNTKHLEQQQRGLITHSSGNHAQAVALAARSRGVPAYIVMPNNAPIPKKNAVKHTYQATVFECEPTNKARAEMTELKRSELMNPIFIHPSNDPRVIAGQGTIALELMEQTDGNLDAVIVPLGGGGMISGVATAIKALNKNVMVYGVEPTNACDALRAKKAGDAKWDGSSKHAGPVKTCADGLKTVLLENNWPIVRDKVDDIYDVSEDEILHAMEMIVSRMKLAIEPSAATGFALARSERFKKLGHSRVGIILCGGNADYGAVFENLREKYC